MIAKPDNIFDRDREWQALARFTQSPGPQLGVVSGRRRQGKTYLLAGLARQTAGFYFGATEATEAEALRRFGESLASFTNDAVPPNFRNWDEAVTYLVRAAETSRKPMVIDEFPYLTQSSPELPSILQRELDRAAFDDRSVSLLLCGSAMSVMGRLLSGNAPLRGRATLELVVRPFDYRLAARYWEIGDPKLAALVHAVVGGTPAHRRFVGGDSPAGLEDFDDWVRRTVLNPETPLFRDARYVLEEGTGVRDAAIYHSLLAAIATGNRTRGGIGNYVGRKGSDIGHQLNVLEDCGLVRREPDLLHVNRSTYSVAEPLVTFYEAIMKPDWGLLESGFAENVWENRRSAFFSQVIGPHFEELCRTFVMTVPDLFGSLPGRVGQGTVFDPVTRKQSQIDVVVLAPGQPGDKRRILSLGEAKWGKRLGHRDLDRLRRARDLLELQGFDTGDTVLALYSANGFEPNLPTEDGRVRTFGLDELYGL